jgi:hypothetical protein
MQVILRDLQKSLVRDGFKGTSKMIWGHESQQGQISAEERI